MSENKKALIIGIDTYNDKDLEPLPSCKKDAKDIFNLLKNKLKYSVYGNKPIIGSQLDKKYGYTKIREAIFDFFDKAKPGQTTLFYFSGHGINNKGKIYLASPQVNPNEPRTAGFSINELTEAMDSSPSKEVVGIIDSCYSGDAKIVNTLLKKKSAKDEVNRATANYDKLWKTVPKAKGITLLLSCQSDEVSNAIPDDNSLYSKYLIEGLAGVKPKVNSKGRIIRYSGSVEGDGDLTTKSLHEYVYKKVGDETNQLPRHESSESQTIIIKDYPDLAIVKPEQPESLAKPEKFADKEAQHTIERFKKENEILKLQPKYEKEKRKNERLTARLKKTSRPKLEKDTQKLPTNVDSIMKKATKFYDDDEFQNAISTFDLVLKQEPRHFLALFFKAESLRMLSKYEESIRFFDKALKIDPGDVDALTSMGSSLRMLSKYEESIRFFDKALKIDPNFVDALGGKGESLRMLDKYEESIRFFDKALKIDPNDDDALSSKGDSLRMLGKYKESLRYLDKALKIDPNDVAALRSKGESLRMLDKNKEAMRFIDKALEINPNYLDALRSKGAVLIDLDKYKESLPYLDKALKKEPENVFALYTKGESLRMLSKYKESIRFFDKVLEIDPNDDDALSSKAESLRMLDKYEESIRFFDKALKINPNNSFAKESKKVAQDEFDKL